MKRKIFGLFLMILTLSILSSSELLTTLPNIIVGVEVNTDSSMYAALNGGKVTVYNSKHVFLTEILDHEVVAIRWLSVEHLALAAGESIIVNNFKNASRPVTERTIPTEGNVVTLDGNATTIFFGTKNNTIFRVNWKEKEPSPALFAITKAEPMFIRLTKETVLIVSESELPRLYDYTGLMLAVLENEPYSPITSVDLKPGTSTVALGTDAGQILEYAIDKNRYSMAKRDPLRITNLGSAVRAIKYNVNQRYLIAGLADAEIRILDIEQIVNGAYTIANRTDFPGGSLNAIAVLENNILVVAAGRNLLTESGGGSLLRVSYNPPNTSVKLILRYTDGHHEEKLFNAFSYSRTQDDWWVSPGDAIIEAASTGVLIEGETQLKMEQGKVNQITLKTDTVPPPPLPEAPPIPNIKANSVTGMAFFGPVLTVTHPGMMSIWSGDKAVHVPLDDIPFPLASSQGITVVGFHNKIVAYNSDGKEHFTIPVSTRPNFINYCDDTIAAVIDNTVMLWKGRQKKCEIKVDTAVTALALSANTETILVGNNRLLKRYDSNGHEFEVLTPIRNADISTLALNVTGRYLAIGYDDFTTRICDASNGKVLREFQLQCPIMSLSFLDENNIAVQVKKSNGEALLVVDVQTTKTLNEIPGYVVILPNNIIVSSTTEGISLLRGNTKVGVLLTDGNEYYFQYRKSDGTYNFGGTNIKPNGKLPF
jgi:WD40 repeat protein